MPKEEAPQSSGDTIQATIGEGASTVAVGKNIIQIGKLIIPYWLATTVALLALSAFGGIS
jgi:hypothetical protein